MSGLKTSLTVLFQDIGLLHVATDSLNSPGLASHVRCHRPEQQTHLHLGRLQDFQVTASGIQERTQLGTDAVPRRAQAKHRLPNGSSQEALLESRLRARRLAYFTRQTSELRPFAIRGSVRHGSSVALAV